MTPAAIPAPEVVDRPGVGIATRNLSSRVADTATMHQGTWHIAVADAYLPIEKDLLPLLGEIGDPDIDVWERPASP